MLLIPKNLTNSKYHIRNKRLKKLVSRQQSDVFCLVASNSGFLCNKQAEYIKTTLRRTFKKRLKISFNFVANSSITKKPNETRMGKGKAELCY